MTGVMGAVPVSGAGCGHPPASLASVGMTSLRTRVVPLAVRCLLTVAALFATVLTAAGAAALVPGPLGPVVAGVTAVLVAFALAAALARFVDRRPVDGLRLRWDRWAPVSVLAGVVASLLAGAAAVLLAVPVGAVTAGPGPLPEWVGAVPVVLVSAFLVQGIPEEVLFRGYLVRTAGDRLPLWGVVVLSSVLFGSLHVLSRSGADTVSEQALYVVMAVGLGALASAARLASGSVWAAVGVHGGFHVTVFVISPWLVPAPEAYGGYLALLAATQLLAAGLLLSRVVRSGRLAWREPLPQGR